MGRYVGAFPAGRPEMGIGTTVGWTTLIKNDMRYVSKIQFPQGVKNVSISQRFLFPLVSFFAFSFCVGSESRADPITLTINNPTQFGTPGTTLTFSGTLTNLGPTVAPIRGGALSAPPPLITPMFLFPNLDLEPGQSTGVIPLFRVTINPTFQTAEPFVVNGNLAINPASPLPFAFATYQVIVLPVAEPATILLLSSGLSGAYAMVRRKGMRRENFLARGKHLR